MNLTIKPLRKAFPLPKDKGKEMINSRMIWYIGARFVDERFKCKSGKVIKDYQQGNAFASDQ